MNITPYERDGFMIYIHDPIDLPTDVEVIDRPCDVSIRTHNTIKDVSITDIAKLLFRSFYNPKFKLSIAKSEYYCNIAIGVKMYRFKISWSDTVDGYIKQLADQINL